MEIEIDEKYDKAKYFNNFKRLPLVIFNKPINVEIEEEFKEKFSNKNIKKYYPSSKHLYKTDIYMYGGIAAFFGLFCPLLFSIGEDRLPSFWAYVLMFAPAIFCARIAYTYWKKYKVAPELAHITYDRLGEFITLPRIGESEYFKIPFTQLRASIEHLGGSAMTYSGKHLVFYRGYSTNLIKMNSAKLPMGGLNVEPKAIWSFYVWYMDKNRPLPPGTAFDEYREEDFERRKSEGFPPPLFKSLIPTPEATSAQQLVREAFWRDEDYMATEEEAHYSLLRKKPKKRD